MTTHINPDTFQSVNDLTRLTRNQDRIISELYLELQKQLPKYHRWMKPIPATDGEDLLNEAVSRVCQKPWQLPHTKEEIEPIIQSYIMVCKKEFISNHHRRGQLSQEYAREQPKTTELELTPEMIVDTNSSIMQDALNKAIFLSIINDRKVTHIASEHSVHRSTVHRRLNKMRTVTTK